MQDTREVSVSGSGEAEERQGIQVIARSAAILRLLSEHPLGLSLGVVAKQVGLPRSTVQRIVAALEAEQFVAVSRPGSGVRLGPALLRLVARLETDILTLARKDVETVCREADETVIFMQVVGGEARMLFHVESEQEVRVVPKPPPNYPLHTTAHGKLALARLSDVEVGILVGPGPLLQLTEQTIDDVPTLLGELAEVRRTGLAYDREERGRGQCAVGAEVVYAGQCYTIVVLMPAYRFARGVHRIEAALLGIRDGAGTSRPGIGRLATRLDPANRSGQS